MIVYLALLFLLVVSPVVGLCFSIPFYFKAKSKKTIVLTSILLGILVGYFSYLMIPSADFDIVRHQEVVSTYSRVSNLGEFFDVSGLINMEIIPQFLMYIVSRFNDPNILQFVCVSIGYAALFYILVDYKNKIKMSNSKFIPLFILMLFGQSTLFFFSGLFNYMAINLFALAFYLDYEKHKKIPAYILYLMVPFIHNSMLFPLAYLILFKILGNKFNKKFVITSIVGTLFATSVLAFLAETTDLRIFKMTKSALDAYLVSDNAMKRIYDGLFLAYGLVEFAFASAMCFLARKEEKNNPYLFSIVLSIASIIMMMSSIVMIRFSALVLYLSIVPMMGMMSRKNKLAKYAFIAVCILAVLFAIYNIYEIHSYGYSDLTITDFINKWPLRWL